MKYIKSYILFFLMVFAVTGCTTDDLKDDVNGLKDRVTLIEEQVKLLNDKGDFEVAENPLNRYSSIRKKLSIQKLGPGMT